MFAVIPVAAAAGVGSLGARRAPAIYRRLEKPQWAPPAATFGPVWSVLYVGIGVAGWRLYSRTNRRTKMLHLVQLALNAAWPIAFFGIRDKRASLLIIALLDAVVAAEILAVRQDDLASAYLLAPYLSWNLFATALNIAVNYPDPTH
jgi:benzodiazapine receptor